MRTEDMAYVGFWARVGASIIDIILVWAIIGPLLTLYYGTAYWQASEGLVAGWVDVLLSWVFPAVATLLFWFAKDATPGKMAIGAVIVDARTGEKPSSGQYVLRYVGYLISSVVLALGIIWVAFDRRKQGWHDKMAQTVVVKKAPKP